MALRRVGWTKTHRRLWQPAAKPGGKRFQKEKRKGRFDMVTSKQATTYEVDIEDVEYLRHGDTPLLARLVSASRRRAVPDHGRAARRRLGAWRPPEREPRQRGAGPERRDRGGAGLPGPARSVVSGILRRHPLWNPLVQEPGGGVGTASPARSAPWEPPVVRIRRCCWVCGPTIRATLPCPSPMGPRRSTAR